MPYTPKSEPPESILGTIQILDYGFTEYVEHWGCDERIIEAARMSTGKGFLGWDAGPCEPCGGSGQVDGSIGVWYDHPLGWKTGEQICVRTGVRRVSPGKVRCIVCNGSGKLAGDAKLLKYLHVNRHSTPFEMAGMTLTIQAPIAVFREWHRHRTQSYSEMSARYVALPNTNYVPTPERCLMVAGANKQAGRIVGADELTHEQALEWIELLEKSYEVCEAVYQSGLARGIPKELARMIMPVGRYSRMMASTDLRNWLGFLTLRMDKNAQWEIRQFAYQVGRYVKAIYPRTWDLFIEGKELETI